MYVDSDTGRVYLTVLEVSKRWKMSTDTITKFYMVHGLKAQKIAKAYVISLSDLTAFEQRRLIPSLDGKIKRLMAFRKRIEEPMQLPATT